MTVQIISRDGRTGHELTAGFGAGPWLVVAPHDDDAVIGCGVTMAAATAAGIEVHVAVVSDGRMGWDDPADAERLVAIRREELVASLAAVGVPSERLHCLDFPDGSLNLHRGCRPDAQGSGVGRALTRLMRQIRPGTVFCCTGADLHPDHKITAEETAMAACWAGGAIWREFGDPIPAPRLWDYAVYCDFPAPPALQLRADRSELAAKLAAMRCYASQPFIDDLIQRLSEDGPVEYFAAASWRPYRPEHYAGFFAATPEAAGAAAFAADCRLTLEALADWQPWPALAAAVADRLPLVVVGEGSSRLFPAAFARHLLRRHGLPLGLEACGGRAAEAVDWRRCRALLSSNSGGTRELIELIDRADFAQPPLALLGLDSGELAQRVAAHRSLLPRPEQAVAATASVFLQALTLGAAVVEAAGEQPPLDALRSGLARVLDDPIPAALLSALRGARRVWWADPETGIADELALKTLELCGLPGISAPGTLALHGCEEIFESGDRLLWFAPDPRDSALRERIASTTGVPVIDLLAQWPLPDCGAWSPLLWLAAGWRLLAAVAADLGRDPAHPQRARKIGNPVVR